jgi:hypothetical protein
MELVIHQDSRKLEASYERLCSLELVSYTLRSKETRNGSQMWT